MAFLEYSILGILVLLGILLIIALIIQYRKGAKENGWLDAMITTGVPLFFILAALLAVLLGVSVGEKRKYASDSTLKTEYIDKFGNIKYLSEDEPNGFWAISTEMLNNYIAEYEFFRALESKPELKETLLANSNWFSEYYQYLEKQYSLGEPLSILEHQPNETDEEYDRRVHSAYIDYAEEYRKIREKWKGGDD